MNIEELKKKLKEAKDPEKFLKELMDKTKDKNLKEAIKKLLDKNETAGESRLEKTVREVSLRLIKREPELTLEIPEVIENRREARVSGVRPDLVVDRKRREDYVGGGKSGKDYKTGTVIQQLEESHLVAKDGHLGTTETQSLIDRKFGEYDIHRANDKYSDDRKYNVPKAGGFVQPSEFEEVLTTEERMARKKKKLGDYV